MRNVTIEPLEADLFAVYQEDEEGTSCLILSTSNIAELSRLAAACSVYLVTGNDDEKEPPECREGTQGVR